MKLDIDESVKPSRQPHIPAAFHLREVVEKELLAPIEAEILEIVDQKSEPTPWMSSMVIVPKDKPVDEQGRPRPHQNIYCFPRKRTLRPVLN